MKTRLATVTERVDVGEKVHQIEMREVGHQLQRARVVGRKVPAPVAEVVQRRDARQMIGQVVQRQNARRPQRKGEPRRQRQPDCQPIAVASCEIAERAQNWHHGGYATEVW